FAMAKVSLVDHHTAARHFMRHIAREESARRAITGQWNWLVPPMSGSTMPVFHRGYKNTILKPNFFYQEDPWESSIDRPGSATGPSTCPFHPATVRPADRRAFSSLAAPPAPRPRGAATRQSRRG